MRRFALIAAVAVGVFAIPAAASAYPAPSGLTSAPTVCPARPNDESAFALNSAPAGPFPAIGASSNIASMQGPVQPGSTVTATIFDPSSQTAEFTISLIDSSASGSPVVQTAYAVNGAATVTLPDAAGQSYAVQLRNINASTTDHVAGWLDTYQSGPDSTYLAQGISDSCATQHADAQATAAAVKALAPQGTTLGDIKTAINGLTANSTTLDTLNADLAVLHADNQTIESDVLASGGGGGGTSCATPPCTQDVAFTNPVQLSPADRQLEADVAGQTDGDLWVLVGVIVGCFAAGFILNRVWPS